MQGPAWHRPEPRQPRRPPRPGRLPDRAARPPLRLLSRPRGKSGQRMTGALRVISGLAAAVIVPYVLYIGSRTVRVVVFRVMTWRMLAGHVPGRYCAGGDQPAAGHRRGEPPCVQPAPSRPARGRGERGAGTLLGRLVSLLDYRTAYRVVGRVVAAAVDRGDTDLTADLVQAAAEQITGELIRSRRTRWRPRPIPSGR
jgi:hypothetical protein